MLLVEALCVLLLVDAVSGVVHWAEDSFWEESTPVIGRWIIQPNMAHHRNGTAFVADGWLKSSWDLLAAGMLTLLVAWKLDCLTWHVWLFALLGVNANQIHKWNHMPSHRVPLVVRALRSAGVLQSPRHHANHHRGARNTHYCIITPLLNPLLDRLGLWRRAENLLRPLLPLRAEPVASRANIVSVSLRWNHTSGNADGHTGRRNWQHGNQRRRAD